MDGVAQQRWRISVNGIVQGVGFRPFVYSLAKTHQLTGRIYNNAAGVVIEVQGEQLDLFIKQLMDKAPPLAKISHIDKQIIFPKFNEKNFTIEKSQPGKVLTNTSPDVSICQQCLAELFDPQSHYYRYPFINCTHCGPRYTIIKQLPYDRCQTSMSPFMLCDHCQQSYDDPLDRRYHAQPVACQQCGPRLSHSIKDMAQALNNGEIIALKALGGYQLLCDANQPVAIKRLRKNKQRDDKPFAMMVLNVASAKQFVRCSPAEEDLLASRQRPIVLLPRIKRHDDVIAPGLNTLGIMLPYTPIHYLLFNALLENPDGTVWLKDSGNIALVVTSANPGGLPLIKDDEQAQQQLTNIADKIVSYDREILTRVDDSVMRVSHQQPVFIRRARSFTPLAIPLVTEIPSILAVGAQLKNTVCITRGKEAFLSQHIGDLDNRATIQFFHETVKHLLKLLDVKPTCVAHDRHPDFYTTQYAHSLNIPTMAIQHHHAHIASVLAEQECKQPVLGLSLDGFGLGDNHQHWGGELFLCHTKNIVRLGSLKPLPQPGGDKVITQVWRMGVAALWQMNKIRLVPKLFAQQENAQAIVNLLNKQMNIPMTSSCGRLFDAASALLGVCHTTSYEGQAAMQLESFVTQVETLTGGWQIEQDQLSLLPTLLTLLDCDPQTGANLFHGTLVAALADWIQHFAHRHQLDSVVLSGGCFLNHVLTTELIKTLIAMGIKPLIAQQAPINDGGISLGQAWLAGLHQKDNIHVSGNTRTNHSFA